MRKNTLLILSFIAIGVAAQISDTSLIIDVLADYDVNNNINEFCGLENGPFVVSSGSGYFVCDSTNIKYREVLPQSDVESKVIASVEIVKIRKSRAVVRIHFVQNNDFNFKVTTRQYGDSFWLVRSYLAYEDNKWPNVWPELFAYHFSN